MSEDRIIRPSSAYRWILCPGSAKLCLGAERKDNVYAREGRAAHLLADWCFKTCNDAVAYPGKTIRDSESGDYEITDDMREAVTEYVTVVREMADNANIMSELSLDDMLGGQSGTIDAAILNPVDREIQVHDLKYGRRPVEAERNPQLMIYADAVVKLANALFGPDEFDGVRLVIHQPNLGIVDEWACSADELAEEIEKIETAAELAVRLAAYPNSQMEQIKAYLNPGLKQCQWCDAKAACPALETQVRTTIMDDFEDISTPISKPKLEAAVERVRTGSDNTHIACLLPSVDLIQLWCEAVKDRAREALMAGEDVPNHKLVEGRAGTRKWMDEEAAAVKLKNQRLKRKEIWVEKIISPAQAEKKIGKEKYKKVLASIVVQGKCKPQVVVMSDKRPAFVPTADQFENLNESEME